MNMKKIVFLSLLVLCLPGVLSAQSIDDDLYYTPSKNKEEKKEEVKQEKKVAAPVEEIVVKSNVPTTVYSSRVFPLRSFTTTVVLPGDE